MEFSEKTCRDDSCWEPKMFHFHPFSHIVHPNSLPIVNPNRVPMIHVDYPLVN